MPYDHGYPEGYTPHPHMPQLPHVGKRKMKSLLAVFIGFWLWQAVRLAFPSLEVHPLYIYIYGIIEMRENSEKTMNMGKRRIKATFIALSVGVPTLLVVSEIKKVLAEQWHTTLEISVILGGVLLILELAEKAQCKTHCGLASVIFIILVVSHAEDDMMIYAVLRAVQTLGGVFVAWLINVKLFPYPPRPKEERFALFRKKEKSE